MNKPLYDIPNVSDFREMLDNSAVHFGENNAFLFKDSSETLTGITYRELRQSVNALGTALLYRGLQGKNIALCAENSYRWCLSYLSVCCGVGTVVPLDNRLPADETENLLHLSHAKALLADSRTLTKLDITKLKKGMVIVCLDKNESDIPALDFRQLMNEGSDLLSRGKTAYLSAELNPDEMSILLFTSGTTGIAKGVMLSQRNVCSDVVSASSIIKITSSDIELNLLPLYHAYESLVFLAFMNAGGCVAFCGGIRRLSQGLSEVHPTVLCAVPLIIEKLHAKITHGGVAKRATVTAAKAAARLASKTKPGAERLLFSKIHEALGGRLRFVITGAAAINPAVARDFNTFGIPIIIGYGLTECSPIVICNNDREYLPDSIGKPIPGTQVKIENPDSEGVGEILVKGPTVMLGYYEDKKATAMAMRDGWFHTGDLGYCDKDGFYYIAGRAKNLIVTKTGKNIYPEELEYRLQSEAAVKEALVYGKQTESGVIVAAEIYPDSETIGKAQGGSTPTKKQLKEAVAKAVRNVNGKLPNYKGIAYFELREEEFPKTTTAKIKRKS